MYFHSGLANSIGMLYKTIILQGLLFGFHVFYNFKKALHYTYIIHIIVEYENIAFAQHHTSDVFDIAFMKTKQMLFNFGWL